MAEKIKIAELNIDDKALLDSLQKTKISIQNLSDAQKVLKITGDENSKGFIENEAKLKTLRGEYGRQIKVLQATTTSNVKYKQALDKEIKSIDDAVANNKDLRKVRNQLNASTEEGAKAIADINKKIDDNTDFVKENSSALEKQKQNIGNYKESIKGALSELNPFNVGVKQSVANFKEMGGLKGIMKSFFSVVTTGFRSVTAAMAANPYIAAAAAIAAVIGGLIKLTGDYVKRNEDAADEIDTAWSRISGTFKGLRQSAEPLGEYLAGNFAKALEVVADGMNAAQRASASLARTLGFTKYAETIEGITATSLANRELIKTEQSYRDSIRNSRKDLLNAQRAAEQFRQERDNVNKSIEDRVIANDKLGVQLEAQAKAEVAIAEQGIAIAKARIAVDGASSDAKDFLADKEMELADVQERIEGQRSEQLVNRNNLIKEGTDAERDSIAASKVISDQKIEDEKTKSDEEIVRLQEFDDRKRQLEVDAELRNIEDETAREELRLERELEKFEAQLERDVENGTLLEDEKRVLLELKTKETADAVQVIKDKADKDALTAKAKSDKKFLDAQIKAGDAIVKQEKKKAEAVASVASQLAGILQGFLGDTLLAQIAAIAVEAGIAAASVIIASNAAQAKNLAQATSLGFPLNIAAIPIAIAQNVGTGVAATKSVGSIVGAAAISGLGAIAKNLQQGAKKKRGAVETFADGGILNGASHSAGGIQTPYGELEGGEAVINKRSTSLFRPVLSRLNQAGGGKAFANGGILGSDSGSNGDSIIDYERLASAVGNLPAPQVSVEEISTVATNVEVIENNSTF